jgi:hypothetical protein
MGMAGSYQQGVNFIQPHRLAGKANGSDDKGGYKCCDKGG